jgi:hypothetical protein
MNDLCDSATLDQANAISPTWRDRLLARLESGMGRPMSDADRASLLWNDANGTVTVQASPLLAELRARGMASNVFRSRLRSH